MLTPDRVLERLERGERIPGNYRRAALRRRAKVSTAGTQTNAAPETQEYKRIMNCSGIREEDKKALRERYDSRFTAVVVLTGFMDCWKSQDWATMAKFVQKSQTTKGLEEKLENNYGHIFFDAYTAKVVGGTPTVAEFTISMMTEAFGELKRNARVIFEVGVWGVNPVSVLRPV